MVEAGGEPTDTPRGRPRTIDDATILHAALDAFAAQGYDAMSMRRLGADLGLSHGALHQRFGSKDDLFAAAVEHGVAQMVGAVRSALLDGRTVPGDDLGKLREEIRAFLIGSALHPQIGRLVIITAQVGAERSASVFQQSTSPHITRMGKRLRRLVDAGVVRDITIGQLWFLMAHGGGGPYNAPALARLFDPGSPEIDPVCHAEMVADLIVQGLRLH